MTTNKEVKKEETKEPFFHIEKNPSLSMPRAIGVRAAAILLALVFCGLLTTILTGVNPIDFYSKMVFGAFGTTNNFLVTIQHLAFLLCISLAVTPAFKMKFWNTGAEGQVLMGGLATAICMYYGKALPLWLLLILMFVSAMVAGALWGIIPAFFKAHWDTNETLFTLMMNYVAMQLIIFFMRQWNKLSAGIDFYQLDPTRRIGEFFNGSTGVRKYVIYVVVVAAVTVFMHLYLKYSKHGYELTVVGESRNTARYIGIDVKKVIIRTMALSGLICGICGFLIVGSAQNISSNSAGGMGFTAIMVSWLSKFNPLVMIVVSLFLAALDGGAIAVSTELEISKSFSDIVTGILLFFIIGCEFFIQYKLVPTARFKSLFKKNKEEK